MKKMNFKIRTIAIALFSTLTITTVSIPAMASKNKTASIKPVLQPSITFLGASGNSSTFAIQNNSEAPVKFVLSVTDAEGTVIYSQAYEASNFSKVFQFVAEKNYSSPLDLSFKIEVPATGEKHNFEVNTLTEVVKDVQVTKL